MLIKRLRLKKILSFNDSEIELGPLNVLIGPNGAGRSNLIEVIGLLQPAPSSIARATLRGGGVRQGCWLGDAVPSPIANVECEWESQAQVMSERQSSESQEGFVILIERLSDPLHREDTSHFVRTGQLAIVSQLDGDGVHASFPKNAITTATRPSMVLDCSN